MATITYKGLSGIRGTLTVNSTDTLADIAAAIIAVEELNGDYYADFILDRNNTISFTNNSTDTYAELGLLSTDTLVAILENDPSVYNKEQRQLQKLEIAQVKRAGDGNPRATYDVTQLPNLYNGNAVDPDDNPNVGGLVVGRPWINTVAAFTFFEAFGTTTTISTTQYVLGNKIYAESSSYDVSIPAPPARVVVNDIEVLRQGDTPNPPGRGHNLVVLDTYGDVVTAATQYDTYIDPANLTTLASALNSVASGNIVVLVSYDASALNATVRTAINTGYGSTNNNTWTAERRSHIFIGVKI